MPDAVITAGLVSDSAFDRLDDFRVLADIVCASPALAGHWEPWQHAVLDLDALAVHERIAIGSSPLFRRWLHATARSLITGASPAAAEPLLASVGNYVPGFAEMSSRSRMLMSRGGRIETWDCAGSIELPPGYGDHGWVCKRKGAWIQLSRPSMGGQTLRSCLILPEAVLPRSHIVVRNDLPGLRVVLDDTHASGRGSAAREPATDISEQCYPQGRHRPIVEAAQALLSVWPEAYEDWRCTMRVVVPSLPPPGRQVEGFTISSMQGAAWIHPSSPLRTLESLVHEHSHVKLRYIEEAVPLLQATQTHVRFPVRWSNDPRPVGAIFEGVYEQLHCAMALCRYLQDYRLEAAVRREAAVRLVELRAQAREGLELLRAHACFTAAGLGFLRWADSSLRDS